MVSSRTYLLLLHWTSSFSSDDTIGARRAAPRSSALLTALRASDRSIAVLLAFSRRGPPLALTLVSAPACSARVDLPPPLLRPLLCASVLVHTPPRFLSTELPVPSLCRGLQ
ncbi:hypothetical protein Syun_026142 [Stephania yunnanensis]|uniref:Uncharacterized protein n=1 Tax=Stephania yunnanensis TaxID=152371 RepID=A0AAP0EVV3_9MAGN